MVELSQPYVTTGKTIALTIRTFVSRVMCLLFNTLWVCHCFPAKKQMSSDLMAAVTICSDFGAQEEEISHYFHLSLFFLPCSNGAKCHNLSFFLILVLSQFFHCPLSPSSRDSWVPLRFLPLEWYHPHIWSFWCFPHLSWFWFITHPVQHFSWCAPRIG